MKGLIDDTVSWKWARYCKIKHAFFFARKLSDDEQGLKLELEVVLSGATNAPRNRLFDTQRLDRPLGIKVK